MDLHLQTLGILHVSVVLYSAPASILEYNAGLLG